MITDMEAAVRRMRAVVGVLDEDLASYDGLLATPLPDAQLSGDAWRTAEADRRRVEESLRVTELAAAEAIARVRRWRENAAFATTRASTSSVSLNIADSMISRFASLPDVAFVRAQAMVCAIANGEP